MEPTRFEPYSGIVEKAPTRNSNFFYGTYLLSDLDDLFEAGVPRGPRILVGAILLNFLRNQFVAHKRRKWHAPQKWYLHNQFSEKIFSRQFIGESLDWLVKVGVVLKEKEPGHTNQICYSFIGFPSNGREEEDLATAKRKLINAAESPIQNDISFDCPKPHPDATEPHPDATEPHPSYIYKNNKSPSQKPTGGESCVTFENRKNNQQEGYQQFQVIDKDEVVQRSKGINNQNEKFSSKYKFVSLDKGSERTLSPVPGVTVNSIIPAREAQLYRRSDSMLSEDELSPEHYHRYKDRAFMEYVARKWSKAGGEKSYTGAQETLADKICVVEKNFLKNPPNIDVQWKAFINGKVTMCIEKLVDSREKGLTQQYLYEEELRRYLPAIAIEMQSENPVATEPELLSMGQLLGQYQPTSAIEMEAELEEVTCLSAVSESVNADVSDLLNDQVISEPKPEVALLNKDITHLAISSPSDAVAPVEDAEGTPPIAILQEIYKKVGGRSLVTSQIASNPQWGYAIVDDNIVVKEVQKPELDWDAIAQEVEQVEQMGLGQGLLSQSDDGRGSQLDDLSDAIAQQVEQRLGPVTMEAFEDLEGRSLTDCAIAGGISESHAKDEITSETVGIASYGKLSEVVKNKIEESSRLAQMNQERHSRRRDEEHKRLLEIDKELQSRFMTKQNQGITRKAPGDEYDF